MKNQQVFERLACAIGNVGLLALFQEYDRVDVVVEICGADFNLAEDEIEWCQYDELLAATGDFLAFSNWHDEYDYNYYGCNKYYVSSAPLREYYDLCRIHAKRHGCRYRKDPYVTKADLFVRETFLYGVPYSICARISTSPSHKYGNGIAIETYEDFCGFFGLIAALLEITEYFKREVEVLRRKLGEERKEAA